MASEQKDPLVFYVNHQINAVGKNVGGINSLMT